MQRYTISIIFNKPLNYLQEEHRLLVAFAPLPDPAQIQQTYATLLNPPSMLLSSTLGSLTALVKRSLHRYTLLALGVMGALSSVQPRWEATAASRGSQRGDELRDANSALRSLALRSFPEFLADVKAAALGSAKGGDVGTSIADVTLSVRDANFRSYIPSIQSICYRRWLILNGFRM
jgi:exocyst complex component 7